MANSLRSKTRISAISPGWIDTNDFQKSKQEMELFSRDHSQHLVGRVEQPAGCRNK